MRPTLLAAALIGLAGPVLAAPKIVADMPATASLVQQVAGDLAEVSVLLPAGTDVHHYQMRPSDARALQGADLLVWIGPELTPWLDHAADSLGAGTGDLRLISLPGLEKQAYGADEGHEEHDHSEHGHDDHEHDHDHGHDDHHDHDGHDHSGTDPHLWLDPGNAVIWLQAIATQLSDRDPENAATYEANARAAQEKIVALDNQIAKELAPFADRSFVVFHDAYGYFTRHFGLKAALAVSLGDASSPSAARLREIRDQIASTGATCAFPEHAHDPRLIDTVIEGSPATVGGALDPLGGTLEQGPDLYAGIVKGMADTLTACLSKG